MNSNSLEPPKKDIFDQVMLEMQSTQSQGDVASAESEATEKGDIFDEVADEWTQSALRSFLQLPLGYLKKFTWPLDVYKLWGTGESLAAYDEIEERLPELKKKFPNLDWPETIDKEAYMRATQGAVDLIPTQSTVEQFVEEKTGIPLEPKTGLQKKLRLAGEAGGFKEGGITSKLTAAGAAPGISVGLEKMGVPEEYAEGIALLASQVRLGKMGKIASAEGEALVNRAKEIGLTEREIVPLMQSPTKRRLFTKFSKKGAKTEALIKDTQEMLGNGYAQLAQTEAASSSLPQRQIEKTLDSIDKALKKLPVKARKTIEPDVVELATGDMTGTKLINFYQDVNYHMKQGEHGLVVLKDPIKSALGEISPSLASDFELTNQLYSRFAEVRKHLTPGMMDNFITGAEFISGAGGLIKGIITGNFSELIGVIGVDLGRRLATEMVTNPKLFNLSRKLLTATGQTAKSIMGHMADEIKVFDEDLAEELREYDPSIWLNKASTKR